MLGSEFRVVDLTRDEVSDDHRHPVYRGRVSIVLGPREEKHTLGIEEDSVLPKVRPLKHAPQLRDVFLAVRSHCVDP